MRGFIPLLLALSASYTTVTALPQPRIVHRDATAKPKYSVVPLEPGDDDPASGDLGGGNGDGHGNGGSSNGSGGGSSDNDGDGVVTVIRTVTRKPVTKIVTQTEKPSIVTAPGKTVTKAVPTTVSVINMDDEPVTETVTVPHPSSKPKAPEKPTTTQEPGTTTDEREPIAQGTTDLSSAAAPGVTSQPQPIPQPEPEPESPTSVESPQTTETSSVTCITDYPPPVETVAQPPPTIESPAPVSEPTTLHTQTSESAGAPEQTERPTPDAPVAPIPSQGTFAESHATQDQSWSTAAVPYEPPVAPTTLIKLTTTTTSITETSTLEPSSASKTHDNGAWHTSYPAWNGTVLAI